MRLGGINQFAIPHWHDGAVQSQSPFARRPRAMEQTFPTAIRSRISLSAWSVMSIVGGLSWMAIFHLI